MTEKVWFLADDVYQRISWRREKRVLNHLHHDSSSKYEEDQETFGRSWFWFISKVKYSTQQRKNLDFHVLSADRERISLTGKQAGRIGAVAISPLHDRIKQRRWIKKALSRDLYCEESVLVNPSEINWEPRFKVADKEEYKAESWTDYSWMLNQFICIWPTIARRYQGCSIVTIKDINICILISTYQLLTLRDEYDMKF